MKKLALLIAMALTGWTLAAGAPPPGVSFSVFYDALSPHGEWIHAGSGVYAWLPGGMASGWKPYYHGRWVWTDDGWFWDSDEPWAWAVYHYGRWYDDDEYGWVWVPGYDWSPAWVEWRYGGECMGWAPLGPYALFSMSWGIHYTRHWATPLSYWTFVDGRNFCRPGVHEFAYRTNENSRWFGRTRGAGSVVPDGNRIITRGPERNYVERVGNVRIDRADVVSVTDRPSERVLRGNGGRERIEVYRPRIDGGPTRGEPARPGRVAEEGKPLNLDVRNADVRSRDVAREQGRDLGRADQYRSRLAEEGFRRGAGNPRPEGDSRLWNNPERRDRGAVERRAYSSPWGRQREYDHTPSRRDEPIDRPPRFDRLERRSDPPERTVRRPESRPERGVSGGDRGAGQSSPRGGGESSGGGARRGGVRR